MLTDAHLLRGYAKHGSQDAFRQLVERHLPLVYRASLRQLNSDTHRAQDVAQMVFVALARQARSLATHPNLSAWLYSTTHRITCQAIRTEMRRRKREHVWAEEAAETDRDDTSVWPAIAPVLDESIRALGTKDREAIILRFFGNRSLAEVGEALRIGEDAARMRINRALERLREQFSARGVSVASPTLASLLSADASLGAPAGLTSKVVSAAAQVAPGTLSTLSATFYLMAGSKLITSAAAVAAAIAVGIAMQQWSAARAAAAEVESIREDASSLRLRMAQIKRSPTPAAPSLGRPSAQTAQADDPWAADFAKGDEFLASHPEIREALIRSHRAQIRGKYLPLYQDLHLTDGQIDQVEALLIGARGKPWKGVGLWVGEHLTPDQLDVRLRALLGEEGFARFKAARLPGSGEIVVEQLASRLAFMAEPLTAEEGIAVRDIIDETRAIVGPNGDPWAEALPRLETVLTPAQMDEVKAIHAADRYQRAQAAAKKGPP